MLWSVPGWLVTCSGFAGSSHRVVLLGQHQQGARQRHDEVSQVLFRLSRWENLEHAKKI